MNIEEQYLKKFDEEFIYPMTDYTKGDFKSFLKSSLQEAYLAGKKEVIEDIPDTEECYCGCGQEYSNPLEQELRSKHLSNQ